MVVPWLKLLICNEHVMPSGMVLSHEIWRELCKIIVCQAMEVG
jgi:hypothetical protein